MRKYVWNAEDYAKHSAAQQGWARELISRLQLEGHESILDIGCGDGRITVEIAAAVPRGRVLGIDNSNSMIELAKRTFPAARYPNLTFQLAGWIRTTWLPYTQRIPQKQRDAFINELADNYILEFPPDAKGCIHVHMVRLEVEAQKAA